MDDYDKKRDEAYFERINEKNEMIMLGKDLSVYKKIARDALMSWNGLSKEEATNKVREESNEELESQVYAQGSIKYALEGIVDWNNRFYQENQEKFAVDCTKYLISEEDFSEMQDEIMNGGDEYYDYYNNTLAEIGNKLPFGKYLFTSEDYEHYIRPGNDEKNDMILSALSHIHDGWVKDNQKKFMARDKKYQHMPLELIGWDEAKSDLLFLGPILNAMDVEYNIASLEEAYDNKVKEFFRTKNIKEISQLTGEITKGAEFYPALEGQDDILQALQDSQFVSETVIPSIQEKGIGADKNAMDRIEQWKERSSKLAAARARKKELQKEAELITETEKIIDAKENDGKSIE